MPICPKCETEYRDGFETCFDCDIALVESIERPKSLDSLEEQFAEDMFAEEEESVRFCVNCFVEFAPEAAICVPCGHRSLETAPRRIYEQILRRSALVPYQRQDEEEAPRGLVRVFVAHTPAEAGFACASLHGMGVDAVPGDDRMDDVEDPGHIGIWVSAEDVEACQMILPDDPAEWRDEEEAEPDDPCQALVNRASAYHGLGKNSHAVHLCSQAIEMDGERPEAFFALGQIVGAQGMYQQARESFQAAVERSPQGVAGAAAWFFVVYSFLDDRGEACFVGPQADEAMALLISFSERNPRNVEALRLLLEAAFVRGEKARVRDVRERILKVNRRLLDEDLPFAAMTFED